MGSLALAAVSIFGFSSSAQASGRTGSDCYSYNAPKLQVCRNASSESDVLTVQYSKAVFVESARVFVRVVSEKYGVLIDREADMKPSQDGTHFVYTAPQFLPEQGFWKVEVAFRTFSRFPSGSALDSWDSLGGRNYQFIFPGTQE